MENIDLSIRIRRMYASHIHIYGASVEKVYNFYFYFLISFILLRNCKNFFNYKLKLII